MTEKLTSTRSDCEAVVTIRDKVLGPPTRGVHHGRGPHVPMPDTWDRRGPVPIGWTGYDGATEDKGQWTCAVPKAALSAASKSGLTAEELVKLNQAIAAAEEPVKELAFEELGKDVVVKK